MTLSEFNNIDEAIAFLLKRKRCQYPLLLADVIQHLQAEIKRKDEIIEANTKLFREWREVIRLAEPIIRKDALETASKIRCPINQATAAIVALEHLIKEDK